MDHHQPLQPLRRTLALLACVVMLLAGVAQQRAFATQQAVPAFGAMALCLPGMGSPDDGGSSTPSLHDCFSCCLGSLPALASQTASLIERPYGQYSDGVLPEGRLPAEASTSSPCSRGPPGEA